MRDNELRKAFFVPRKRGSSSGLPLGYPARKRGTGGNGLRLGCSRFGPLPHFAGWQRKCLRSKGRTRKVFTTHCPIGGRKGKTEFQARRRDGLMVAGLGMAGD